MKAVNLFLMLAPLSLIGSAEAQTVIPPNKAAPTTTPVPQPFYRITGPGIRNPAEYALPLGVPVSLAAAVGKAGGFNPQAKLKEVYIIRVFPNRTSTLRLDASSAGVMKSFRVRSGDDITVLSSRPPRHDYLLRQWMLRH